MTRQLLLWVILLAGLSGRSQYSLQHINIIDVETGKLLKNQTIFIEGGRIRSILPDAGDAGKVRVYDCTGKYLIPGLWDMHIHDSDDSEFRYKYIPLFIANGVLGVRDMWGSPEMLVLKKQIDTGSFMGPRLIVGSDIIDGKVHLFNGELMAETEAQGRHFVDSLADAGYDFIKIYSFVREPVYLAIAAECRKRNIGLMGHLPLEVGLEEALDAGQRSFEHNFNIDRYLVGRESELLKWSHDYLDTVHSVRDGQYLIHNEPLHISTTNFRLPSAVLGKMISNRVAIVPTLTLSRGFGQSREAMLRETKGLEYLNPSTIEYWTGHPMHFPKDFERIFGATAKYLMDKGVLVLAGTDVNNPFCIAGFGLQQELVNLHRAGLSNLQALQTATLNPAKFLYKEQETGEVRAGKRADLLVLDANPLEDIANTQKINAVIINGKYLSTGDIHWMLERVTGRAWTPPVIDSLVGKLMDTAKVTGLCLGVIRNNKVDYVQAYGYKNKGMGWKNDTATDFYGASLSKAVFAYIVMQLADEGRIDLDKPLYTYLPKPLPEYDNYKDLASDERWKLITARHCLDHTTGFPNWRQLNPHDNKKLEIFFNPGQRYAYSGEGLVLLQLVVETITGEGLENLARERVFKPFGMRRTGYVWRPEFETDYGFGHLTNETSIPKRRRTQPNAAGSLETTIADYTRFVAAVMRGDGLSPNAKQEMIRPQIEIHSRHQFPSLDTATNDEDRQVGLAYGLGWGVFNTAIGKAFFKEGHDDGWEHYSICLPGRKEAFVIMTNSSNGENIFSELVYKLSGVAIPWYWEGYTPYH
jgi:CubicO group peptidase (beta-lactamase class C family)